MCFPQQYTLKKHQPGQSHFLVFKTQDGFEPFRQTTKIFLYPFIHLLRVSLIARDETRTHNIILYVMEKNFCCKCLNARHIFLLCALPIELPQPIYFFCSLLNNYILSCFPVFVNSILTYFLFLLSFIIRQGEKAPTH